MLSFIVATNTVLRRVLVCAIDEQTPANWQGDMDGPRYT